MFGLINRSLQCFVEDTYSRDVWNGIVRDAGLDFRDFEAMLSYDDAITDAVLGAATALLDKDETTFLEDLGTYLVTHEHMEAVRRLLRFGGQDFEDFLHSLDDLHDRVKLALPDLEMPVLELRKYGTGSYGLYCKSDRCGYCAVLLGILRAMADDYGALVLLDLTTASGDAGVTQQLRIDLLETSFAEGRSFQISAGMVRAP